jgi:hypothetical protein
VPTGRDAEARRSGRASRGERPRPGRVHRDRKVKLDAGDNTVCNGESTPCGLTVHQATSRSWYYLVGRFERYVGYSSWADFVNVVWSARFGLLPWCAAPGWLGRRLFDWLWIRFGYRRGRLASFERRVNLVRDPSSLCDLVAVGQCPGTYLLVVFPAGGRGRTAAAGGGRCSRLAGGDPDPPAADALTSFDVPREYVTQRLGVLIGQVDLVRHAIQRERHRLGRNPAIEVVNYLNENFLSHAASLSIRVSWLKESTEMANESIVRGSYGDLRGHAAHDLGQTFVALEPTGDLADAKLSQLLGSCKRSVGFANADDFDESADTATAL